LSNCVFLWGTKLFSFPRTRIFSLPLFFSPYGVLPFLLGFVQPFLTNVQSCLRTFCCGAVPPPFRVPFLNDGSFLRCERASFFFWGIRFPPSCGWSLKRGDIFLVERPSVAGRTDFPLRCAGQSGRFEKFVFSSFTCLFQ